MIDAVVIGSGPNGLVAANLLADAGWNVLVLEAQPHYGGAVRTAEVTLPGFRHDLFSAFYPLARASPVFRALDLDFIPVGGTAAVKPEPITVSLDGTNVSFKRASGSEAATGSVNALTGYFFATNSTEMWSGWWGKAGWYSRVQSMTPAAARLRPPVADITKHPATLDTVARDLWIEKVRTLEDQTAFVIPFDPFGLLLLNRPNDSSDVPPEFRHAVAQFLAANGGLTQDTLDRAFPGGYDPIVVPPPNPLAFPLAGVVPGLSPQGAQREIATGMRILDRAGEGIRSLSPYVPGSALLVTAGGSPGAAGATPSAPGTVGTSSSMAGRSTSGTSRSRRTTRCRLTPSLLAITG